MGPLQYAAVPAPPEILLYRWNDVGEETPVRKLVLLPGMHGTGKLFAPFIGALPPEFEALPISYPVDRPLSYPELAELARTRLPVTEPFVILAESFSTPLAIQIAAANPSGLKALIIVAGFVTNPSYPWLPGFGALLLPGRMRILLPDLVVRRALLGPAASHGLVNEVKKTVLSMNSEVFSSRLRSVSSCDSRKALKQVIVPMLYLQATKDRVVPPRCLSEIVAVKPDVTVTQIDGPHLLLQLEPQKSAEIITQFIQQIR
jgi:pimeloyl-[acyl-carrier protein] methyl ester esterase